MIFLYVLAYVASAGIAAGVYKHLGADLTTDGAALAIICWPVPLAFVLLIMPGLMTYWLVYARKEEHETNLARNAGQAGTTQQVQRCPYCGEDLP